MVDVGMKCCACGEPTTVTHYNAAAFDMLRQAEGFHSHSHSTGAVCNAELYRCVNDTYSTYTRVNYPLIAGYSAIG